MRNLRIIIRVDKRERKQFARAAKAAKKTLSVWVREMAERESKPRQPAPVAPVTTTLSAALIDSPAVAMVSVDSVAVTEAGATVLMVDSEHPAAVAVESAMRRSTPTEIAANVPGLRVGLPPNYRPPTKYQINLTWAEIWPGLVTKINDDPDTFYEEMKRLAPGFKPKQNFWKLSVKSQVAALEERYPLEGK